LQQLHEQHLQRRTSHSAKNLQQLKQTMHVMCGLWEQYSSVRYTAGCRCTDSSKSRAAGTKQLRQQQQQHHTHLCQHDAQAMQGSKFGKLGPLVLVGFTVSGALAAGALAAGA
jgi:hypothetical protein